MLQLATYTDEDDYKLFKKENISLPKEISFTMPPLNLCPKDFVNKYFGPESDAKNFQFLKGTTTLAFIYEPKTENDLGGIVIAVDSRASSGGYISSKSVMKILHINDRMSATMAGGAADCQFWTRVVAKYCNLFELREKSPITVRAASNYLASVLYTRRHNDLSVYSMIAGIDNRGPSIFHVNSTGENIKQTKICSLGSGSLYAYGFLDTYYQSKMTDEEAINLGRQAIMHATYRDIGSGGVCNITHITRKGKTNYLNADVSEMYYKFAEKMNREIAPEILDDN